MYHGFIFQLFVIMARKWIEKNFSVDAVLGDVRQPFIQYPPPHFFPNSEGDPGSQIGTGGSDDDPDDDSSDDSDWSWSGNSTSGSDSDDSDSDASNITICTPASSSSQGLFNPTPSTSRSPIANISLGLRLDDSHTILEFIMVKFLNVRDDGTQGTYCWFIVGYVLLVYIAKECNIQPMQVDNSGDPSFYQIFMEIVRDCGNVARKPLPLLKKLIEEVNVITYEPRLHDLNARNQLSILNDDQEGQLFFEVIAYLPNFKFAQFGAKTIVVYSVIICPHCNQRINEDQKNHTVSTDEQFNSLLYVPFPKRRSLEQMIQDEFDTMDNILYDCPQDGCRAPNIGSKSRSVVLETCNTGLMVSVTRRDPSTQRKIADPIDLGENVITLHAGTDREISLILTAAIEHRVLG